MENEQENKASFKFKMPQMNSSAADQQAGGSSSSPGDVNLSKTNCSVCNKEFVSAKALSGHMRVHGSATKKQQGLEDVIRARNQPILKKQRNRSRSDSQSLLPTLHPCDHCSKVFRTAVSLFGHMRCHPERAWRGMRPPSQELPTWRVKARRGRRSLKNQAEEVSWSYVDLDSDEDEVDDEERRRTLDGVNDLLLLKNSGSSGSSGLSTLAAAAKGNSYREEGFDEMRSVGNGFGEQVGKKRRGNVDDYPVVSKMTREVGGSSADHKMRDCIGFVHQEGNAVGNNSDAEDGSDGINTELVIGNKTRDKDNHGDLAIGNGKSKGTRKVRLIKELMITQEKPPAVGGSGSSAQAAAAIASEKYKCSTCDKCFSSPQALGGHRSSHYKLKVTVINGTDSVPDKHPIQISSSVSAFAPPAQTLVSNEELNKSHQQQPLKSEECATKGNYFDEVGGSSKADPDHFSSTVYQCTMCYKEFPSGQALGGHKRCHWAALADGQTEAEVPPLVQAGTSGEEAGTQAGGKRIRLMGVDLDVPPSLVPDAEDLVAAGWY
ncbi:uncharacterized protein LOC108217423 [Daucus carota subsp. sativus]|nr:PREDICTED: uncharacterized protein LOC108217423 [Daucus carota subsp. sativus]